MDLSAHVSACLRRHKLDGAVGIVAVSGGPDSVCLAHLLQQANLARLIIAHVNHQLRGDESDRDEMFVQSLAASWQGVTCRTVMIDVAGLAEKEGENLESIARRVRYEWLTQVAREENAAWVATGHTADDQAETVLFRLLRGSGVLGLGGMSECRPLDDAVLLIRPLLTVRRQTLLDFLRDKKISYCVDSSNRDLRFRRNRLRVELLPQLQRDHNPAIVDVLCRLADQAQELQADIAASAARLLHEAELPRAGAMLVFSVDRLQQASANLMREMFRLVWKREAWPRGDMDFEHWQRLVEIVNGTCAACDFPGKIHVRRVGNVIRLGIKS